MSDENQEKQAKELSFSEQYNKISNSPEMAAILKQHGEIYLQGKEGEIGRNAMGKGWKMVDDALIDATGLEARPDGMNTSDWAKAIALENNKLKEQLSNKEEAPKANANEDLKQLHNTEVNTLKERIAKMEQANESLVLSGIQQKTNQAITSALHGASFNPALGETVLGELIEIRKNKLVSNSKVVDGKTIYYNEGNEPHMNANGLPMSAKEVTQLVFKDLFHSKTAGGNANDKDDSKSVVKGDYLQMSNISNIETFSVFNKEFGKAMSVKGWAKHEPRYKELQKATQDKYFPNGLRME